MKDMIVKINQAYCPTLIKEMMEKYQLANYAELYDKLVEEIEKKVAELPDNVIAKKMRQLNTYEKCKFVQACIEGKDAVISREFFNLDNIVDNIKELSENNDR